MGSLLWLSYIPVKSINCDTTVALFCPFKTPVRHCPRWGIQLAACATVNFTVVKWIVPGWIFKSLPHSHSHRSSRYTKRYFMSFKLRFNQLFLSEQLFLPPHTVVSLKAMEMLCYFSVCTIKVHGFIGFFFFFFVCQVVLSQELPARQSSSSHWVKILLRCKNLHRLNTSKYCTLLSLQHICNHFPWNSSSFSFILLCNDNDGCFQWSTSSISYIYL